MRILKRGIAAMSEGTPDAFSMKPGSKVSHGTREATLDRLLIEPVSPVSA
jgi:hypothetical protein